MNYSKSLLSRKDDQSNYSGKNWANVIFLFGLILLSRIIYVSLYAEDLPFMDQWEAESDRLLKPWLEDTYHWTELFSLHANEHRIVYTRLWTLFLAAANSWQWDNLVEAYANTLLYAGSMTLIYFLATKNELPSTNKKIIFFFILLISILPIDWENFTIGFQSQFYLLIASAALTVAIAAHGRESYRTLFLCVAVGVMSFGTMASGMLSLPAAMSVYIARNLQKRWSFRLMMSAAVLLTGLSLLLLKFVPSPHHDYAAHNFGEFIHAFIYTLAWPTKWMTLSAIIIWIPFIVWTCRFLIWRKADRTDLFFFGLTCWAVLQAIAISAARGGPIDSTGITSRYTEVVCIGLLGNIWFATRLFVYYNEFKATKSWSLLVRSVAAFSGVFITLGLLLATPSYWHGMKERRKLILIQVDNVRHYTNSNDITALKQPFLHIPYVSSEFLQSRLNDPTYIRILPPSIRHPLALSYTPNHDMTKRISVLQNDNESRFIGTPPISIWNRSNTVTSKAVTSSLPYITMRVFSAIGSKGAIELESTTENLATYADIDTHGQWVTIYMRTPGQTFTVSSRGHINSIAFTQPIELGRLSMLAHWLQDRVRGIVYSRKRNEATSKLIWNLSTPQFRDTSADVPPPLSSTSVWSPIPHPKEIGREEALFRRADHRLPA